MRATSQGACTAGVLQYLASLPLGGLLNGNVYTQVIKNCSKKELEPLILKHTELGTVYSDKLLMMGDYGAKAHYRINNGADEFGKNHINREFLSLC